jgi:hypothetical protein
MLRRIVAALGLLFTAVGFTVVVAPSVTNIARLPDIPMVVVGTLAIVLAVATFAARKRIDFRDPVEASARASGLEDRFEPPRPGAEVDEQLTAGAGSIDVQLRERLRHLVVQVLVESEGLTEAEAERRLADGTWTEDRTAASLFAEDVSPPAEDVVASITGAAAVRKRRVSHVLAELERRAGVDVEGSD